MARGRERDSPHGFENGKTPEKVRNARSVVKENSFSVAGGQKTFVTFCKRYCSKLLQSALHCMGGNGREFSTGPSVKENEERCADVQQKEFPLYRICKITITHKYTAERQNPLGSAAKKYLRDRKIA